MLTRVEIDGFKTFQKFGLDLRPLSAIVGPNASGKSNLFDALRFLSLLAQHDIRTAMQDLRGLPEELFRRTAQETSSRMHFAIEVLLNREGFDAFGTPYIIHAQRLRYELVLQLSKGPEGLPRSVSVRRERCFAISKAEDRSASWLPRNINYNARVSPFIRISEAGDAIEIRQDGRQKHGKPVKLSLKDASRTALSTVTTAEFPHLYALRDFLSKITFLELNPKAARSPNDRFESRDLRSDASNLSAVLARLKEDTATDKRPDGVLADIALDLSSLIPSVKRVKVVDDILQRQYAFNVEFYDQLAFSSRLISDGTLRLLALLTVLNDPERGGSLCFEEPENGVHEGRIPILVQTLRQATSIDDVNGRYFQIIVNTHSPAVMANLNDEEIVAADMVFEVDPKSNTKTNRTRMRTGIVASADLFNPEKHLTRGEIERLLRSLSDAA